jgi:hypothetical protein
MWKLAIQTRMEALDMEDVGNLGKRIPIPLPSASSSPKAGNFIYDGRFREDMLKASNSIPIIIETKAESQLAELRFNVDHFENHFQLFMDHLDTLEHAVNTMVEFHTETKNRPLECTMNLQQALADSILSKLLLAESDLHHLKGIVQQKLKRE